MAKVPILLLAAGGSSRMGQPKQLLPWGEQTLIEHQVQTLMKSNRNPLKKSKRALKDTPDGHSRKQKRPYIAVKS